MDAPVHDMLRRLGHLSEHFRELRDGVERAVRIADDDPEMALTRARKVLEFVVRDVFTRRCHEPPGTRPLEGLLQRLVKDGHLPTRLEAYANTVRMLGNVGTHRFGETITPADVYQSLSQLMPILEWYFQAERPEALASLPAVSASPPPPQPSLRPPAVKSRRRWWLAAGVCGLAVLALAVFLPRLLRPEEAPVSPTGPTGGTVGPSRGRPAVQVLSLNVLHFATAPGGFAEKRGVLGKQSFAARFGDSVTVEARLTRPAYAYLIAFRPDGTEELCFPEDAGTPPPLTDRPRYPSVSRGVNYGLDEGTGLALFAVVVSERPLPAYRAWREPLGVAPWKNQVTPPGVVWWDEGAGVDALTADDPTGQRGKGRQVPGKTAVANLTEWLRRAPGITTVAAVGFAVLPKARD